jgi:hypothetical protein
MCFIVHKTTSELEREILTTLYFAGAENTYRGFVSMKLGECCSPSAP